MECRLQQVDGPWRSQVLLRLELDANGDKMIEIKEAQFGPVVDDTIELEKMIRRAQFAILNPTIPAERFVTLDIDEKAVIPSS